MKHLSRAGFLLLSFHLLLGLGFMAGFSALFDLSPTARVALLCFHFLVNSVVWVILLSATGVLLGLPLVRRRPLLSFAVRLVPGAAWTLNVLLWAGDVVSVEHVNMNLSFEITAGAVGRVLPYYRLLAPPWVWWTAALSFVASCCLYAWAAGPGLQDWSLLPADVLQFFRGLPPWLWRFTAAFLILGCAGGAYEFTRVWRTGGGSPLMSKMLPGSVWRKEPLFGFVMQPLATSGNHGFFPDNARRHRMAQQDSQERAQYGRHSVPLKNVILIIVDCLRADHLSFNGYARETTPFLSRLQAEGRLRNVKEVRSSSNGSQGGILSTLASRDFADLGPGMFLIHDVLQSQGFKTYFILAGQHSSFYNLRTLYGPHEDFYFDGDMARHFYRTDDRLLFEGLDQVPAQDPHRPQPAFFYFHLMSIHDIGVRLPEYSPFQAPPEGIWNSRFWERLQPSVNTYDNGVHQADAMIERLFAELDRKHYLENSLVMILGDHGQFLGEHEVWSHAGSQPLFDPVLRIPLLIVDAPNAPYRNLEFALQLDVAPTILDRLSLPVPATWRGRSLLQPDRPRATFHHDTAERGGGSAVVLREQGREWKYLRGPLPGHRREALYELRSDPGEEHDRLFDRAAMGVLSRLRDLAASQR